MRINSRHFFAALLLSGATFANAGVITSAGTASTSNKTTTTTTSGQRNILMNVDPFNVSSFQLDVSFEADKAMFLGVHGLNNYIVDDFIIGTDGSAGLILNIHGFFPGFNDNLLLEGGDTANGLPIQFPPAGEVDIFQLVFLDLRPDLDKHFGVFAGGPDDYLQGVDPLTGQFVRVSGPSNGQTGVSPAFSVVPGIPGGGNNVPLPMAVWMGLAGGVGVMMNAVRRKVAK